MSGVVCAVRVITVGALVNRQDAKISQPTGLHDLVPWRFHLETVRWRTPKQASHRPDRQLVKAVKRRVNGRNGAARNAHHPEHESRVRGAIAITQVQS
jgi:hypothetical protein